MLALFVIAGRRAHHDGGGFLAVAGTALPFLIGWFVAAPALGAFHREAFVDYRPAGVRVLRSWIAGCGVALVIRSIVEHHPTPPSFALVALLFNGALLLLWRSAVVAIVRRALA